MFTPKILHAFSNDDESSAGLKVSLHDVVISGLTAELAAAIQQFKTQHASPPASSATDRLVNNQVD